MEAWPRIVCERFDGESAAAYRRRAAKVAEIVEGFRMGRFAGDVADEMERELMGLQTPELELQ